MSTFVCEYSWMWTDLHLSLAECRVYAYIHGLSQSATRGYNGSKRHLAELLGLDEKSVRNVLNTLMEKNLILSADGLWRSADLVRSSNADSVRESAELLRNNADSVRSPQTPLINNINNSKRLAEMTDFELFFSKFTPFQQGNRSAATELLWDRRSHAAQKAMLDELRDAPKNSVDKNPYFFVQNYAEPTPEWKTGGEKDEDLVQVRYNGAYKICTRATMELFGLQWVRDW